MHNTNGKIVRAITNSVNDNRTLNINGELNGNNIILLRGSKSAKTNLVCDAKLGQIFIQQSDLTEGVLLQSVKRLGTGTPILLLSGNDNGNGHILIQTSGAEETQNNGEFAEEQQPTDNILVQALEGLQDNESTNTRTVSTPLGSGEFYHYFFFLSYLLHEFVLSLSIAPRKVFFSLSLKRTASHFIY